MMEPGQLSNALRITNINDFLAPTNSCVLPLDGGAVPVAAPAGSVLAPIIPSASSSAPASVAKVTVSDCLTCSGCVTSAETVLLSSASVDKLQARTSNEGEIAVAVVSQQSIASIATRYDIPMPTALRKIATFLRKHLHFDVVYDGLCFAQLAVMETTREFLDRTQANLGHDENNEQKKRRKKKPFLTSSCPGWLTYAEKTQDFATVLSSLSTVASSQATFANLTNLLRNRSPPSSSPPEFDAKQKPNPTNIWSLSIAPCHDRKIEAVRPEFQQFGPDCVITTSELDTLMSDARYTFDFAGAIESDVDRVGDDAFFARAGLSEKLESSSDGYAAHAARASACEVLGMSPEEAMESVQFEKVSKSGDVTVAIVSSSSPSTATSKQTVLKFATAYGFRSMQSILRKIKQGTCDYDFVELMACPGGCTNGGGQLPPASTTEAADGNYDRTENKKLLNQVNSHFFNDPPTYSVSTHSHSSSLTLLTDNENSKFVPRITITSRKASNGDDSVAQKPNPASLDW